MSQYTYLDTVVAKAVTVLKQGGIIIYPTDTVWGIGCDATNEQAVQRIFELKQRPESKSMIILVESVAHIKPYVWEITKHHQKLLEQSTVPQTVILPHAFGLAPAVMPLEKTIAVRCPKHVFCRALLRSFERPLVSTSVNISGEAPATTFSEINPKLMMDVDYVIPAVFESGATGKSSRIVTIDEAGKVIVLRA